jgi:hypothetical protein
MAISSWKLAQNETVKRLWEVVEQGWYLGFTAFGGPPVHFKIVGFLQEMCIVGAAPKLYSSMINMSISYVGLMSRW